MIAEELFISILTSVYTYILIFMWYIYQ